MNPDHGWSETSSNSTCSPSGSPNRARVRSRRSSASELDGRPAAGRRGRRATPARPPAARPAGPSPGAPRRGGGGPPPAPPRPPGRPHPVTGLDLVGVADRLPGQAPGRGEQPEDLGPEPVPAGRGRAVAPGGPAPWAVRAGRRRRWRPAGPGPRRRAGPAVAAARRRPRPPARVGRSRRRPGRRCGVPAGGRASGTARPAPAQSRALGTGPDARRAQPNVCRKKATVRSHSSSADCPVVRLGPVLVEEGVAGARVDVELDVLAQALSSALELAGRLGREVVVLLGRMAEHGRIQLRSSRAGRPATG